MPLTLGLLSAGLFSSALFAAGAPAGEAARQLRTALVLGGGGARGAAHIGVLEVLEAEHIPVDCVVGTSMGALVAGAYAAGLSPAQMRAKLAEADWNDMFIDVADYGELSYRKKRVERGLLPGTEIGLSEQGAQLSPGMIAGEKIKLYFNYLINDHQGLRDIENLPLPLAIVATDIGSGDTVVITRGSLSQAMRASMSVPGLMAPVNYEGRKLVDGGLVDNVPVEQGRKLCHADRVIAVNVGSPLRPAEGIGSLLSVTGQMIGILTKQNVEASLSHLRAGDVYVAPELGNLRSTDFGRYNEAADVGRAAALQNLAALRQLSVAPDAYADWQAKRRLPSQDIQRIDVITIAPLKRVSRDFVARLLRQQPGELLDRPQLEQDLIRLYGSGYFDSVDYRLVTREGRQHLEIIASEKAWRDDYITLGFTVAEEYQREANINLRAAYRRTWINRYGGEFYAVADIGTEPYVELDFYQPLGSYQHYFIEPRYVSRRRNTTIFIDNEKIAKFKFDTHYAEVMLGRNLGIWGQVRTGWREYDVKATADISIISLPDAKEVYGGWLTEAVFDSRNHLYFPSRGWRGELGYFDSDDQSYSRVEASFDYAQPLNDWVLGTHLYFLGSHSGQLPVYDAARLGGFLRLSGYATDQILADKAGYGHVRMERIVGRMPLGLRGDMRVGLALEKARVKDAYTFTDKDIELDSALLYLGGETPLGPVYLGYGVTMDSGHNLYFQLGPSAAPH